jgi:alpha/beta superfamily hydrolase
MRPRARPHWCAIPTPSTAAPMHNKVVYRVARGLRREGAVVLRFNYRGVNLSEGVYDRGEGELEDARAGLAYLRGALSGPAVHAGRLFFRITNRASARM